MTGELDVISAFVDGERVDRDELKQALADPAGRDYLMDLLALRESVAELTPQMPVVSAAPPSLTTRILRFGAAAATLVLAVGGGYVAGHRSAEPAASPGATSMAASAPVAAPAPAPTRVIKLEPGVNWVDHNGGQR